MPLYRNVLRDFGHPGTREAGWDALEVLTDSHEDLVRFIAAAQKKFWKLWMQSGGGHLPFAAVLFKPADAMTEWDDALGCTPISQMLHSVDMSACESRAELLLVSLQHHLREATTRQIYFQRIKRVISKYGLSGGAMRDAESGFLDSVAAIIEFDNYASASLADVSAVTTGDGWKLDAEIHLERLTDRVLTPLISLSQARASASIGQQPLVRCISGRAMRRGAAP